MIQKAKKVLGSQMKEGRHAMNAIKDLMCSGENTTAGFVDCKFSNV